MVFFSYGFEPSQYNDISLRDMIYDCRHMIYLLRKHDIISVPSYAEGIYHPPKVDIISKIYHPFQRERISLNRRSHIMLIFDRGGVPLVILRGRLGYARGKALRTVYP